MFRKHLGRVTIVLGALLLSFSAHAAVVLKMDLGELIDRSDKVFRGTVISVEPSTIQVGGGEIPTVIYQFAVNDAIKGNFGQGKSADQITITVVGDLKTQPQSSSEQKFSVLPKGMDFQTGGEYVLFTTPPSAIGLSTTVGLGQGAFRVFNNASGADMVANGLNNAGLFSGPVSYDDLKAAIYATLNQ